MSETTELRDPWLVAVWPGIGNASLLAGGYLMKRLKAARVFEFDPKEFFEARSIEVHKGLATPANLPRSVIYEWKDPAGRHDLLIFMGEAQLQAGGYRFCHKLLDYAMRRGVRRLFTFAALATQLEPGTAGRVFAVATDLPALEQARAAGAQVFEGGEVRGLNGLLLTVGAERGVSGTCLLGELPFFATNVPNPRAACVALECFAKIAAIRLDLRDLEQQADVIEAKLLELLDQMQAEAEAAHEQEAQTEEQDFGTAVPTESAVRHSKPRLDEKVQAKIEALFDQARQDRSKAVDLKAELDRHGVFKIYENRFLDLFRNAE